MLGFYLENRKLLFDAEVLARHLEGVAFELVPLTIIRDGPRDGEGLGARRMTPKGGS
jgi:hypothetical protein